ncbi:DUF4011 domain-containing protein [Paractinoplanes durhamensis]|uniref:DUF4011 domain-containing protein n=1 Tax=Paractinoplanes durhamensis TaxID=113563 RepID=UPI003638BA51
MRPDHAAELSEQPDGVVRAALETWRSGLVDLTDGNRLLNFGRTPSDAVEITRPSPKSILKVLQEGTRSVSPAATARRTRTGRCCAPTWPSTTSVRCCTASTAAPGRR